MHPLHSIKYTAFVTPLGQFEYCYMPFGLKNAGAVRFINRVLREFIDAGKIVVYLDNVSIATEADVLRVLRQNGLELNLGKCKFAYREIDYMGYRMNSGGIRPNNENIRTIQEYPRPLDCEGLERCLGLFSYFRRFLHDFSRTARPLTDLKRDKDFVWSDGC